MADQSYDVVVIGSGITGLSATRHLLATRAGLRVANIEAGNFGGLVLNINTLDGAVEGSGIDVASGLMLEASELGAEFLSDQVEALASTRNGWVVSTAQAQYAARAVIIASGARLKRLGVSGEDRFESNGLSQCADCDGPLFAGKDVVVAGGGDSALQEAAVLAGHCRRVHIVNRADRCTAKPHLVAAIEKCPNVIVRHRSEITAILGNETVEAVQIRDRADGAEAELACSGVFTFIGLEPATDFLPPSLACDDNGFLVTDSALRSADGLFAAGAVRSGYGGMLEDAMAEGIAAADGAINLVAT
jgi:thioredoxin reductase (NADPH)